MSNTYLCISGNIVANAIVATQEFVDQDPTMGGLYNSVVLSGSLVSTDPNNQVWIGWTNNGDGTWSAPQ